MSARHVLKERKWEAFLHVCSSADGRCEVRDHRRAVLPLHGQHHTPTAPHCHSCPVCVSSSSLPSASPQLILRSFCHSFGLHQNSYCVDICSLPRLPCLLWLSCAGKLTTFSAHAILYYFLSSFTLSCHSICYPLSSQKVGVVDTVIRVLGQQGVRNLVTS